MKLNMQQIQKKLLQEASKQINSDFKNATPTTTEGEVFDKLDFIDLVMLAEELFEVSLPYYVDETYSKLSVGTIVCAIWQGVK